MKQVLSGPGTAWPSPAERAEAGRSARRRVPRRVHAEWSPPAGRPDPVDLLQAQAVARLPELLPIRYGRMAASPFAFLRGAAAVMAHDLASIPVSGLRVQACGDAHAANFGMFASPERELQFDLNDFDETLPAPWEWDVQRLVASLAVAGRQLGFPAKQRRRIAIGAAASYREAMRRFADLGHLQVWYSRLDSGVAAQWRPAVRNRQVRTTRQGAARAMRRDSSRALSRLTTTRGGQARFRSEPPLLVPIGELLPGVEAEHLMEGMSGFLATYQSSLRPELQSLLAGYRAVDMARKVVGVGSVGTRAWVVLLVGRDGSDPLVLQAKEAQASVLEPYAGRSTLAHHGQRVVVGQRSMQAVSDILLGWVRTSGLDGVTRDFYVRQLWDWKGSLDPATMMARGLAAYGQACGWTLARAHARTGDRIAIAAYLGSGPAFDQAMASFAERYAELTESDHRSLLEAIRSGRVTAATDC